MANNSNTPNPYQIGDWQNQGGNQNPALQVPNPYQIGTPGNKPGSKPKQPPAIPTYNPALHGPNPYQLGNQSQNTPAPAIPTAPGGGAAGGQVNQDSLQTLGGRRLFVDAARSEAGPRLEDDARTRFLSGSWVPFHDPERTGDPNTTEIGDILPNIQEIFRPMTRAAYEERGGASSGEERNQAWRNMAIRNLNAIGLHPQNGAPQPQPTATLGQDLGTLYRQIGSGSEIGVALAGIPYTIMEGFNALAQGTEQTIGTSFILMQSPELRQIYRDLIRSGDREAARELLNDVWRASRFTFENVMNPSDEEPGLFRPAGTTSEDRINQAFERMQAGEDPEAVWRDIEAELSMKEVLGNAVAQAILDPLNIPVAGGNAGMQAAMEAANTDRFVAASLDEAQAIAEGVNGMFRSTHQIAEGGGNLIDRVTDLLRAQRTPETRVALMMDEVSDVIHGTISSISPQARNTLLRNGVSASPELLALEILMNPHAQDIADTGRSADEIRALMGMSAYTGPDGRLMDRFLSDAAVRTRNVLQNIDLAEDGGIPLFRQWQNIQDMERDALRITNRITRSQALDAVDEQWAQMFSRFDSALRTATGFTEPSGINAAMRSAKKVTDALQGTMATLQMTLSPGWFARNVMTNNTMALADGVRTLLPQHNVASWLAENGFSMPYRKMGAGADTLQGRSLIQKLIDKVPVRRWNEWAEQNMGMRIVQTGIKRVMNNFWTSGKQFDPDAVARLYATVGKEAADEFMTLVSHTFDLKAYDALATAPTGNKLFTTLGKELRQQLVELNLADELRRILGSGADPDEMIRQLNALQTDTFRLAAEAGNSPPVGDWTEIAIKSEDELMGAIGTAIEKKLISARQSEFETTLALQRAAISGSLNLAEKLLDSLRKAGVADEVVQQFELLVAQSSQRARMIQGVNMRQIIDQFRTLLQRKDIPAMAQMPGFRDLSTVGKQSDVVHRFWQRYNYLSDAIYKAGTQDIVGRQLDLINQMGEYLGHAPKDYDSFVRMITGGASLPTSKSYQLLAEFMPIWQGSGFTSANHFRNWLVKNGLAEAVEGGRAFDVADVVSREWVSRVIDALVASKDHALSPEAQRAALNLQAWANSNTYVFSSEVEEAMRPVMRLIESVTGSGAQVADDVEAAADMMSHQSRFAAAASSAIDDVIRHIDESRALLAEPAPEIRNTQAFSDFLRANRQRLVDTRTVAQRVGNDLRDFTLFNYADRRNFDTALGLVYSYPFWYTRNIAGWVRRAYENPAALSALLRFRRTLRQINRDLPEWWQDQLSLETVDGGRIFLPILSMFDPTNSFFGDKFRDADQRSTPVGEVVNEIGQYGPGVAAWMQFAMALSAARSGDRDVALSWLGYLAQVTKAFRAGTALIRNLPGMDRLIPAGGSAVEPWLVDDNGVTVGDKWDRRRVGYALYELANDPNSGVTYEMAMDAAYRQEGEVYERAVQLAAENIAPSVLLSWLMGTGLRSRPDSEVEIAQMDEQRRLILANRDSMTEEQYRQAWVELGETYPWADLVMMFRQDASQRDETLVWSVLNRLPPNNSVYLEAVGITPEYLNNFYSNKGLEGMPPRMRADFINSILQLSAALRAPADATRQEWNDARSSYRALQTMLANEYGADIMDVQDRYYTIRDTEGAAAAAQFLQTHPQLQLYWDDKDRQIQADPLLVRYYGSFDLLERVMWDDFYNQMEVRHPGIEALVDQYYTLRDTNPDAAYDFLDAHPEIGDYWDEKNRWQIAIAEQLNQTSETINLLSPAIVRLREDFGIQTSGEQSLSEMINAGPGGLERWQLPENLNDESLNAQLRLQISSIPQGQYGGLLRYLGQHGGLDDTLNAYRAFGNIETVSANRTELLTLLTEMDNYRTAMGWAVPGESAPTTAEQRRARELAGSIGTGGGRRSSSRYSGGRGGSGGGTNTRVSDDRTIGDVLNQLQSASPSWWGWLRNMADMTEDDMKAFLKDPAHAGLVSWLKAALDVYNLDLKALLDYFRSGKHLMPASKTSKSGSSSYKPNVRFSSPYL